MSSTDAVPATEITVASADLGAIDAILYATDGSFTLLLNAGLTEHVVERLLHHCLCSVTAIAPNGALILNYSRISDPGGEGRGIDTSEEVMSDDPLQLSAAQERLSSSPGLEQG